MLNLTRQENFVIKFLVIFFLIGIGIHYIKGFIVDENAIGNQISEEQRQFEKLAKNVDSVYFENINADDDKTLQIVKKININTATKKELIKISGIGPVTAQKIIDWRDQNGQFKNIQGLVKVKGIGKKTIEKIKVEVTIE